MVYKLLPMFISLWHIVGLAGKLHTLLTYSKILLIYLYVRTCKWQRWENTAYCTIVWGKIVCVLYHTVACRRRPCLATAKGTQRWNKNSQRQEVSKNQALSSHTEDLSHENVGSQLRYRRPLPVCIRSALGQPLHSNLDISGCVWRSCNRVIYTVHRPIHPFYSCSQLNMAQKSHSI